MQTPSSDTPIRCLSLWQPWASLIAWNEKLVETRSWGTDYRGLIAVHAAKRWTDDQVEFCQCDMEAIKALRRHGVDRAALKTRLPFGAIVAVATLSDCIQFAAMHTGGGPWDIGYYDKGGQYHQKRLSDKEFAFGDYSLGRFGWILENITPLPEPIPFRAMQGLFTLPDDVARQLREVSHA